MPYIPCNREEVYSSISTEVHVAIDLHRKQGPDETLKEYIQNFADLPVKEKRIKHIQLS